MAFTKVSFDKVYAGTSSGKDYCAWYTEDTNATPASAFGIYTASGFSACTIAGSTFNTNNFSSIKRTSNFLVPVLISIPNDTNNMITFTDKRYSDNNVNVIYNLALPSGLLSSYDINNELAASLVIDSLIITKKTTTKIDLFSIFYALDNVSIYNSAQNTGIQITAPKTDENILSKANITVSDLKQNYHFYVYSLPFNATSGTASLTEYTWGTGTDAEELTAFYNAVATGKIYVTKASLTATNNFVNPLKHPTYVNGKVKIHYYNSARNIPLETVEVDMSGATTTNIKFLDFSIGSNHKLKYAAKSSSGFSSIQSLNSETYILSTDTSSPYYYNGGILVGWTTDINEGISNVNGVMVPALPTTVTPQFQGGTRITGAIYTNKEFYDNQNRAYFYFSNKRNDKETETGSLTGPNDIQQLEVNLYPLYKKDANYLPNVVEITPRLRGATENNITDTYVSWHKSGVAALFEKIKTYVQEVDGPRDVEENRETGELVDAGPWTTGPKFLRITHGNADTHFVQLGSHIEFSPELIGSTTPTFTADQPTGTFKVLIDGTTHTVPIKGFYSGAGGTSVTISGPLEISSENDGVLNTIRVNGVTTLGNNFTPQGNTAASIYTHGGIYATNNIYGERIFNAVFNDYAEYRSTVDLIPGCVVIDQDDGSLACSSDRLQPGAQVISDTFGHCMGATPTAQTPIAVAGRVLVYPYQNRNNYHAGMAVCSAPGGTVDIMTREEIRDYPDCIVGIVSEIPEYEEWGSNNVKVNGRIWIRVK